MMIAGVDAHICDRCVGQAGGILHAELVKSHNLILWRLQQRRSLTILQNRLKNI